MMATDPAVPEPEEPAGTEPAHPDEAPDVFEGLVLDENFVRGGAYEPPHRTRAAIGRFQAESSSTRYGAPLRPVEDLPGHKKKVRKIRANRAPLRAGRRDLASWLPLTAAITVVALLLLFRR
jgi:hypothetical protein